MFVTLNSSDGTQASGTRVFRSNLNCNDYVINKMYKYANKIFVPAQCNVATLFIYNIATDTFDNIYSSSDTNYQFRNIYFRGSMIYFTGYSIYASPYHKGLITTTKYDAIDTIAFISVSSTMTISEDTDPTHMPTPKTVSLNNFETLPLSSNNEPGMNTGTFVLREYINTDIFPAIAGDSILGLRENQSGLTRNIGLT